MTRRNISEMKSVILFVVTVCGMCLAFVYTKTMTKIAQQAEEREAELFKKYIDKKEKSEE